MGPGGFDQDTIDDAIPPVTATPTGPTMNAARILDNLAGVRDRMIGAARRSGRDPGAVRLVAVTKRHPGDWARPLVEAGVLDLGENYPQELWSKAEELADLPSIRWHLIGHLQSNKARRTLPLVRLVHGVDSARLLATIADLFRDRADPPASCLQVNISGEDSKHGWAPDDLIRDAEALLKTEGAGAGVVGLMTIAGYGTSDEEARPAFARLRELRDQIRAATGHPLPELSMGMSGDFEAAIEEGSTLIRVGSALFEGAEG